MDPHDRTFLEITHGVLYLALTALVLIGAQQLGTLLGGATTDRMLATLLAALVGGLAVAPCSRVLYRMNGFGIDADHARRLRRPAWVIASIVLVVGALIALRA